MFKNIVKAGSSHELSVSISIHLLLGCLLLLTLTVPLLAVLPSMPGTSVLTGERFLANWALKSQACVWVHMPAHLIGWKELLVTDITLEEPLASMDVVVSGQVSQPLEGLSTHRTEVGQLTVHNLGRDITLLPDIFPSKANVVMKAILISIVLSALLTSEHFSGRQLASITRWRGNWETRWRQGGVINKKWFSGKSWSKRDGFWGVGRWVGPGRCLETLGLHIRQGTGEPIVMGVTIGVGESSDIFYRRGRGEGGCRWNCWGVWTGGRCCACWMLWLEMLLLEFGDVIAVRQSCQTRDFGWSTGRRHGGIDTKGCGGNSKMGDKFY